MKKISLLNFNFFIKSCSSHWHLFFLFLLFQLFNISTSYSQDFFKLQIDGIADPYINSGKNTGIIIGIIDNEQTYLYSYGSITKDTLIRPNENTLFEIGSITKVFTAILLVDLAKDNLIQLNDSLQKFLPDSIRLNKFQNTVITLKQLANHTSGLPRLPSNLDMRNKRNPFASYTWNDMYSFLKTFIPPTAAGSKYYYSNSGMALLGNILAQQAEMNYEELVSKKICSPLAMNNTTITLNENQKRVLAQGYNEKRKPVTTWQMPVFEGSGALKSNMKDMIQFLSANIGILKNNPLEVAMDSCQKVSISTVDLQLEIGLGWQISPLGVNGETLVWHNGQTGGYSSYIGFCRQSKTGVIVLSNSAHSVDRIGREIMELINPYNPNLNKKEEEDIIKFYKKIISERKDTIK